MNKLENRPLRLPLPLDGRSLAELRAALAETTRAQRLKDQLARGLTANQIALENLQSEKLIREAYREVKIEADKNYAEHLAKGGTPIVMTESLERDIASRLRLLAGTKTRSELREEGL